MDFSISEDQEALRDLVRQILADRTSHERSAELEKSGQFWDDDLWGALVESGIPGVPVPEAQGGSEFGALACSLVLEEMGRHVAPVPLIPSLVTSQVLRRHATAAQQEQWLAGVAEAGEVLSYALAEPVGGDLLRPGALAKADGDDFLIDGEKACAPAADRARAFLVSARDEEGRARVFVVEAGAPGLTIERALAINHEPVGHLRLAGVRVPSANAIGEASKGPAILESLVQYAQLALSAVQAGVCDEAMRRTAAYLSERKQFGKPLGSLQGPQLRTADAYIDVESMRSVVLQAAWRLDEKLDSDREVMAAKWWAARGGDRVTHSAQHLHGGIGSDLDYPIHRFFLWSQQVGNSLGGGNQLAAQIGARLVMDDARLLG